MRDLNQVRPPEGLDEGQSQAEVGDAIRMVSISLEVRAERSGVGGPLPRHFAGALFASPVRLVSTRDRRKAE